ncbi:hypothetical protein H0H93_003339 [Arthromyces matolae]|nr:hypothetical protein H0H93_003339 [Arthromyces matolae]
MPEGEGTNAEANVNPNANVGRGVGNGNGNGRFRMPLPSSKDAPKFNSEQPAEVRRFLKGMETLFKMAGLKDDQEKKEKVTDYVDAQTDKEWRGLDSYAEGVNWDTFVKDIPASYPEAVKDKGSVANLDRICRENARLSPSTVPFRSLPHVTRHRDPKFAEMSRLSHCFKKLVGQLPSKLPKYGNFASQGTKKSRPGGCPDVYAESNMSTFWSHQKPMPK